MNKITKSLGALFIGVPIMIVLAVLTIVLGLTTKMGFGNGALLKVESWIAMIAAVRVVEILPYKYPVPEAYAVPGHIRFTGIFSHNIRDEPLNPETQEPMMYMARVNFPHRLLTPSAETVRQLERALINRRLKVNQVHVFPPKTPAKLHNTISFTK